MVYFLDKSNDIILGSRYEVILDVQEIMSEMSTTKRSDMRHETTGIDKVLVLK